MKKTTVEGFEFIYFSRDDPLPPTELHGVEVHNMQLPIFDFMCVQLMKDNDFRMIITELRLPDVEKAYFLEYLFWTDGKDLDLIDRKVEHGNHEDNDFALSIKAHASITKCFECEWEGHTLVYFPDLYPRSLEALKARIALRNVVPCPICDKPFRIPVVKIFNE